MKQAIYTLLFIILTVIAAKAQIPAGGSISINVSATVVSDSPVELITLNNINLTDNIDKKEIYISPISSPNAGLMCVKGQPGSQARITYIIKEVLSDENGEGKILMHYEMSSNPQRVQRASTLIDKGETILNFGSDGLYYLWVGGQIDLSKAPPGKYTGQFTIGIEYI